MIKSHTSELNSSFLLSIKCLFSVCHLHTLHQHMHTVYKSNKAWGVRCHFLLSGVKSLSKPCMPIVPIATLSIETLHDVSVFSNHSEDIYLSVNTRCTCWYCTNEMLWFTFVLALFLATYTKGFFYHAKHSRVSFMYWWLWQHCPAHCSKTKQCWWCETPTNKVCWSYL